MKNKILVFIVLTLDRSLIHLIFGFEPSDIRKPANDSNNTEVLIKLKILIKPQQSNKSANEECRGPVKSNIWKGRVEYDHQVAWTTSMRSIYVNSCVKLWTSINSCDWACVVVVPLSKGHIHSNIFSFVTVGTQTFVVL